MKGLLIGNGFEKLFNDNFDFNLVRARIIDKIDNFDQEKMDEYLQAFFQKVSIFAEKEVLLSKNAELFCKKLLKPSLLELDENSNVDQFMNQISVNIGPFLKVYKTGLGPNVIEAFVKNLVLFSLKDEWYQNSSKKIEHFLQLKEIKAYFSQFEYLITTSYSPILELINNNLEIKLSDDRLINLYGNFYNPLPVDLEKCNFLWNGQRNVNYDKKLENVILNQLEIIGLDLNIDRLLWNSILKILKSSANLSNKINYLSNNDNEFKNFYNFLKDFQLKENELFKKFDDFKHQEQNLALTILKNEKAQVDNYGFKLLYDHFVDHNHVSLNRRHATIIKTEFYYNLKKYFEDGYNIEKDNFLLSTTNQFEKVDDLIINFLNLEQNIGGIYNNTFKKYLGFEKVDENLVEKQNLIVVQEVKPLKKGFWKTLFRLQ